MTEFEGKNWNILVYNVSTLHFSRLEGLLNSFIHSTSFVKKLKMYSFI